MKRFMFIISCILVAVLFCLNEYFRWFSTEPANYHLVQPFLKFGMSFIPAMLALYGWKEHRDKLSFWVMLGLILCCVGDVAINISLIAGTLIYICGHLMFLKGFISEKTPVRFQAIAWISAAVLIITALICSKVFIDPEIKVSALIFGCIYTVFMTGMVTCSFCAPVQIRTGGIIFGISDLLLMRNIVFTTTPLSHIISLGVYYIGVMIMAEFIFMKSEKTAL